MACANASATGRIARTGACAARRQGAARPSASRRDSAPPCARSPANVTSTICSPLRAMTASATAPPATHCTGSSAMSRKARLTTLLPAITRSSSARYRAVAQHGEQPRCHQSLGDRTRGQCATDLFHEDGGVQQAESPRPPDACGHAQRKGAELRQARPQRRIESPSAARRARAPCCCSHSRKRANVSRIIC